MKIANMIILIILIIVLLLSFFFINKTLKKKDNILEDVKLQENTIENNGFALMMQQSDGTYQESTSTSWPTDMKFNSKLSGCIDTNGNKIDNALSYANGVITLSTSKTSYCYVYFDLNNELNSNIIENGTTDLWNSTLEEDGYRFVGTNPNNYICFGITDNDTCTNDMDKYMYRIIGIFEDENGEQHAKLIKKEALNTAYAWNSNYSAGVDWNNSDLYKGLNGSYFLTNVSYPYMQDAEWTDKITTWDYTMANTKSLENYYINSVYGPDYNGITAKVMYLHELNRNGKSNEICYYNKSGSNLLDADCNAGEWKILSTKIGLMYASDYALSLGETGLNYVGINNYNTMKTGWMHISNNDSNIPEGNSSNGNEWTISRFGRENGDYPTWVVRPEGYVTGFNVNYTNVVRPVFYLESDVKLSGGTGTISDPYIIAE